MGTIKHIFRIILPLVVVCALPLTQCVSPAKDPSLISDPFPNEMLGHQTFKIFKSGDPKAYLGRIWRDYERQFLGDKVWDGESLGSGGERREIEYSRKQLFSIGARMPNIKINIGVAADSEISFRLVLVGLKIHQFTRPFMLNEFKTDMAIKTTKYIFSLLQCEAVIIQFVDKTGFVIGAEAEIKNMSSGAKYEYSKNYKGLILAKNTIIGFYMTNPEKRDLDRMQPADYKPVEYKTLNDGPAGDMSDINPGEMKKHDHVQPKMIEVKDPKPKDKHKEKPAGDQPPQQPSSDQPPADQQPPQ